ncbi:MAG: hypothetical protein NZL93_05920 [Chthoniobacterales bacterium]|nr:hypothetical protein [Chthoniobacterales bacterium]
MRTFPTHQKFLSSCNAFSLVEVTLALGIVAFALVATMGLLPVGLRSIKNSNERAAASSVATSYVEALHAAISKDNTVRTIFPNETTLRSLSATCYQFPRLTLEGASADDSKKILTAVVDIKQLESDPTKGLSRAIVSVAWTAQANPQWNSSTHSWSRADGHVTIPVQFLPRKIR